MMKVFFLLILFLVFLFDILFLVFLFVVCMPLVFIRMTMIVAAVSVPVVVIVFIDYMVRGVYDVVFFILVVWFVGGVGKGTS